MLRDIIVDTVLVVVGSLIVLFLILLLVALPGLVWYAIRRKRGSATKRIREGALTTDQSGGR